jgi:hypothetical protein
LAEAVISRRLAEANGELRRYLLADDWRLVMSTLPSSPPRMFVVRGATFPTAFVETKDKLRGEALSPWVKWAMVVLVGYEEGWVPMTLAKNIKATGERTAM